MRQYAATLVSTLAVLALRSVEGRTQLQVHNSAADEPAPLSTAGDVGSNGSMGRRMLRTHRDDHQEGAGDATSLAAISAAGGKVAVVDELRAAGRQAAAIASAGSSASSSKAKSTASVASAASSAASVSTSGSLSSSSSSSLSSSSFSEATTSATTAAAAAAAATSSSSSVATAKRASRSSGAHSRLSAHSALDLAKSEAAAAAILGKPVVRKEEDGSGSDDLSIEEQVDLDEHTFQEDGTSFEEPDHFTTLDRSEDFPADSVQEPDAVLDQQEDPAADNYADDDDENHEASVPEQMDFSSAAVAAALQSNSNFDPSLLEANEPFAPRLDDPEEDEEEGFDAYDEARNDDDDEDIAALTEVEDEAILMEDHLELMALGRATMDEAQRSRFKDCATSGQVCKCDGVAMYGSGASWLSLRANESVLCTGDTFGEKSTTTAAGAVTASVNKTCRCYTMEWCEANRPSDGMDYKMDQAHRRRTTSTTQGIDGHQRRRWCGWGPRDCVWAAWSDFGSCSVSCGGGTKTRKRETAMDEANGGTCKGDRVEKATCNTDACPQR